jgi:hypothetical protein
MDFLNKVTNMVGKGIDSIKTQINKAQENAFSAQPQNTNNLPKGVHILGVLENEKENEQEKDQTQNTYSNKYTNFLELIQMQILILIIPIIIILIIINLI